MHYISNAHIFPPPPPPPHPPRRPRSKTDRRPLALADGRARVPRESKRTTIKARDKRTKIFSPLFSPSTGAPGFPSQTAVDTALEEDGTLRGPKEADAA